MMSLSLCTVLQLSMMTAGANTYAEAHKATAETGRPLVVLVGADWCPACERMKNSSIPQVEKGLLSKVSFATINTDRESKLARKLMSGGPIPQLIMYRKTAQGWRRHSLVGAQSPRAIESFLKQGLEAPATDVGAN